MCVAQFRQLLGIDGGKESDILIAASPIISADFSHVVHSKDTHSDRHTSDES